MSTDTTTKTITHDDTTYELDATGVDAILWGYAPTHGSSTILTAWDAASLAREAADCTNDWDDLADKLHQSGYLNSWTSEGTSEALMWQAVAAERACRDAVEAAGIDGHPLTDAWTAEQAYERAAIDALTSTLEGCAALIGHRHVEGSGFAIPVAEVWDWFAGGATNMRLSKDVSISLPHFLRILEGDRMVIMDEDEA